LLDRLGQPDDPVDVGRLLVLEQQTSGGQQDADFHFATGHD
jgi:hypothetical protein